MSDPGSPDQPVRVVVIGADAAGMSAAHQALRTAASRGRHLRVTALERTERTSYSACGLPYLIAGEVAGADALVARTPAEHRAAGIDLRTGVLATGVDLDVRRVHAVGPDGGSLVVEYDELVLATGATPRIPSWAQADGGLVPGVAPVKTLDDGPAWDALLQEATADADRRGELVRAVIVGAGYIGVEMAEALLARDCEVHLLAPGGVLPGFEDPVRERMGAVLAASGVRVHAGRRADGLRRRADGRVAAVRAVDLELPADVVVLATGVQPRSALEIRGGSLPTGDLGAFAPDERQRLAPHVWAAGDCATVEHRLLRRRVFLPLGTHANKQGRVLGENLGGGAARSAGALGTAITRFRAGGHHLEVARTGLGEADARDAGFEPVALLTEGTTISGYLPAAPSAAVWVLADARSRRLLGVQIAGGEGAAKRIDTAAAVLWAEGSVDDLAQLDLAYAPPFATVWDVVQIAARRLADRI
ncbi:FAD-dependent oxidoreductase [Nocardioides sp. TRM66260-LWL]|uniref:FAD-dependent oxidoreductase n=1 Tax=Nocardioides sp. TRM66260-LWL TaxID=2874478 RepID=UPI001CC45C19|nr:FAD-dependent oxidoreductase [Nocardioides sp. TRM66260-LWL]MBZ5733199.1 FAD-dependent oxidoreductase [Nocardioides sp. TRM66260-LWL]